MDIRHKYVMNASYDKIIGEIFKSPQAGNLWAWRNVKPMLMGISTAGLAPGGILCKNVNRQTKVVMQNNSASPVFIFYSIFCTVGTDLTHFII